jgi:hypothetical protein
LGAVIQTNTTVETACASIGAWFDNAMGQSSNQFKRRVRTIAFIGGLGICLVLNVDTLYLARTLWNDPALRLSVANAAESAINNPTSASTSQTATANAQNLNTTLQPLLDLRLPIGWEVPAANSCASTDTNCNQAFTAQSAFDATSPRNLANLLPWNNPSGGWLIFVLNKLIGWVLTTFAIMQGSDFWFNLLGRITSARARLTQAATVLSGGQAAPTSDGGSGSQG